MVVEFYVGVRSDRFSWSNCISKIEVVLVLYFKIHVQKPLTDYQFILIY